MVFLPYDQTSWRTVNRIGIKRSLFVKVDQMENTTGMNSSSSHTPLSVLQTRADEWIKAIGGGYFDELTNMAMLSEEVGEVARIIARRYGMQVEKESDRSKDLGEELADVLFVVLCLANQTGVDLQDAWDQRMAAKTERDRDRFKPKG